MRRKIEKLRYQTREEVIEEWIGVLIALTYLVGLLYLCYKLLISVG